MYGSELVLVTFTVNSDAAETTWGNHIVFCYAGPSAWNALPFLT